MSISFTNNSVAEKEKSMPSLHPHICSRNYFGKTVANQNSVDENILDTLNLENDLYNFYLPFYYLETKGQKYKQLILPHPLPE
jgi:hypothetical protein